MSCLEAAQATYDHTVIALKPLVIASFQANPLLPYDVLNRLCCSLGKLLRANQAPYADVVPAAVAEVCQRIMENETFWQPKDVDRRIEAGKALVTDLVAEVLHDKLTEGSSLPCD